MTDLWATFNDRQRTYLQALYECDQTEEASRRQLAARGHWSSVKASEWRWQMYGPVAPPSALYTALRSADLVDPGTGATWQALEDRKLVQCRYVSDPFGVQLLQVQITPLGRKVVRAATGEQPKSKPPKGQLRPRQWAALARLYAAGDGGIWSEEMMYGRGGFDWTQTLLRLRDYKPTPLMEEYPTPYQDNGDGTYKAPEDRLRITPFGRAYYAREWQRYRELYPDIDAPALELTHEQ
jgi:hypothetical protein